MKKLTPAQQLDAMIILIRPLIKDCQFGCGHLLNIGGRFKGKASKRLINGNKRLIEDIDLDNQGFMKIISVTPLRELQI